MGRCIDNGSGAAAPGDPKPDGASWFVVKVAVGKNGLPKRM